MKKILTLITVIILSLMLSSCSLDVYEEIKSWHLNSEDIIRIYNDWYSYNEVGQGYVFVNYTTDGRAVITVYEDSNQKNHGITLIVCNDENQAQEVCELWKKDYNVNLFSETKVDTFNNIVYRYQDKKYLEPLEYHIKKYLGLVGTVWYDLIPVL